MNTSRIRRHFPAISNGKRICTDNAASTQIPKDLLELSDRLYIQYGNVHRGQYRASKETTDRFEEAYKKIAAFIGSEDWRTILLYRGTTEAINAVMYSLMTEFEDGDNVVTTYMEHNSNYVPWYALCREIAPKFGKRIEYRVVGFDKESGELDLEDLEEKVDRKTKIICCTGASNFLGTKPPLHVILKIARQSDYDQPNGSQGSYLLVDGAQLVPNAPINVESMNIDFLAWSFHKMLAPVGIGGLFVKKDILETLRPFHYGGDMIAEGKVTVEKVEYDELPWRFTAGTPNIIGTILAGEATELIVELVLGKRLDGDLERQSIEKAMRAIQEYEKVLTQHLIDELESIDNVTVYGPRKASRRTTAVAFNIAGKDPFKVAEQLDDMKIESRAGCHCATLAHYYLEINPPASCRISPYFYNTLEEMRHVTEAIRKISAESIPKYRHTKEGAYKILKTWIESIRTFGSDAY